MLFILSCQKDFGQKTELGKRRTIISGAVQEVEMNIETLIEKEPITVVLSKQGWIRALKGSNANLDELKFKEGDSLAFAINTYTTEHVMLFATNGRFYSILGNNIVGGRGFGEPIRLSIDLPENADIVEMFIFKPDQKLLVASRNGKGFIVDSCENGKEAVDILNASEEGYYSLVLMDVQMPVMNGYEATEAIRSSSRDYLKNIPILAMSANTFPEDILRSKNAGMNDHISKPVDINVFSSLVDKYVKD